MACQQANVEVLSLCIFYLHLGNQSFIHLTDAMLPVKQNDGNLQVLKTRTDVVPVLQVKFPRERILND